ncbi:hypothetical protein MTR67_025143 [Solanum verrucosum]|uniref:Nutrient reservoir n=2 Tax=Eukaryota TaxID=2759 RepID=A0AAF0R089_SOLVR|nr:hypothetical protein MTR67_025143 [Solanum verrucosum]
MGTPSPPHSQFIFHIFTLLFLISLDHYYSQAMAKDQLSCTMCSSCDNPCQPISPPPPPSSSGYICPPPPPVYVSPPNNGGGYGGGNYPPPNNNPYGYPTPPPPNPIVPYFPFYFHSPPPPTSKSIQLKKHPCLIFGVAIFFLL